MIDFAVSQDPTTLTQEPLSRLHQWMIGDGCWELFGYRSLRLDLIPESIDADEIASWLATELSNAGKNVLLKRWIAPCQFKETNFSAVNP